MYVENGQETIVVFKNSHGVHSMSVDDESYARMMNEEDIEIIDEWPNTERRENNHLFDYLNSIGVKRQK